MRNVIKVAAIATVVSLAQGWARTVSAPIAGSSFTTAAMESIESRKKISESLIGDKISNARMVAEFRKSVDKRSCIINFSIENGEKVGTLTYYKASSFEFFKNITKENAFSNLLSAISSSGYTIVNSDKNSDVISTEDFNITVTNCTSGGIRVELSCLFYAMSLHDNDPFSIDLDKIQNKFCQFLSSVTQ